MSRETGEKIILRTDKSWFIQISDHLKAKCFDALSTTVFCPQLNIKDTEQTHKDVEKLKKRKGSKKRRKGLDKEDDIGSYYLNILEELTDFNEWCISDKTDWGIPVPYFKFKENGKILMDQEIIEHFAMLVEKHGTSNIWYEFETSDLLPPRYKKHAQSLEKQYQVFDSWFDSSLSWNYALKDHAQTLQGGQNPAFVDMCSKLLDLDTGSESMKQRLMLEGAEEESEPRGRRVRR